jgi:hypothetical protein
MTSADKVVKIGEGVIRDYTNPKSNDKYVIIDLWRGSVDSNHVKTQDISNGWCNTIQQETVESQNPILEKLGDNKRFLKSIRFFFW